MRQIGRLEKVREKSGLVSITGITKYKRITNEMLEICYDIV